MFANATRLVKSVNIFCKRFLIYGTQVTVPAMGGKNNSGFFDE